VASDGKAVRVYDVDAA
jgi:hypothetical protein